MMNIRRTARRAWLALLVLAAACSQQGGATQDNNPTMKASTTYLYLLRKTPFFTSLDTPQLRWVIAHSHEWEAQPGTVISPGATEQGEDDFWILLDGRWQVEHDGHAWPAGHADAGKWFSAAEAANATGATRLIATEHSYVMKITRADMDDMLSRGFGFGTHLQQGHTYYQTMFAALKPGQ
jgi:hypothetical protein